MSSCGMYVYSGDLPGYYVCTGNAQDCCACNILEALNKASEDWDVKGKNSEELLKLCDDIQSMMETIKRKNEENCKTGVFKFNFSSWIMSKRIWKSMEAEMFRMQFCLGDISLMSENRIDLPCNDGKARCN